jgi:hypothetical protein
MARVFKTGITAEGDITAGNNLRSSYTAGDEGGQIFLNKAATNTTITSGVNIDVYQNKLRFWEDGGSNRGFYLDMTTGGTSVGTNLVGGGSGTVTSVGLSLPSIFTVSNSPVTTTGTLTATLASQAQQLFLAGPASSSGTPTFRYITTSDFTQYASPSIGQALVAAPVTGGWAWGTFLSASGGTVSGNVTVTGYVIDHISTNSQTASYTLAIGDDGKVVEMNVGTIGNTLTIPLNSSVAFPVGTQITVLQVGTGQTSIAVASGVTLNATPQATANTAKLRAQWSSVTLLKRATDTWVAMGDLAF